MKLPLLGIATALLAASTFTTARAQVGIYGKFNSVHASSGSGTNYYTPGWFYGPGGGVYFNVVHLGPVALGGDIRADYLFQSPQRYRDALFGVRLAAKAPVIPIRPYAQVSAGIGGTSKTGPAGRNYTNKFQYWVFGGVDYTVFPHIDWRVVEAGYGHMTGISSSPPATGVNLFTVSTGIVVRFP